MNPKQAAAEERQHPTPTIPGSAAAALSKSIAGSTAQPEMFVPQPQQVCSCCPCIIAKIAS